MFLRTSKLFSLAAAILLQFHQQCYRFQFLHVLVLCVICCCCCFEKSNPNACKVTSHCDFIVISLMISDVEHLFMCLLADFVYFLWRNVYSSPLPIFD